MAETDKAAKRDARAAEALIAEADTGARAPVGTVSKSLLFLIPLAWSLFQLWYSSPLPFAFNIFILNDTEARAIHLAFSVLLAFIAYPTFRSSPRDGIPPQDWIIGLVGAFCAAYLYIFYVELSGRPGNPTTFDLVTAVTGMVILLEATRRALGPPLMVVAGVFLLYAFAGPYMPDVIAHKGASLSKGMSHYWLSTEGVFGIALGVSTGMVFMFVLFGSLLEKAGAGNYFIRVAFAAMGHMRGGPAKAAVVSSAMTGMVSGSSIANVVTTGTFTIPLMRRVGFSPEKSGAVEVASSTNGQLTPPIMGAAAFLMVEYVGISYIEVIKHAFLPAVISYIALIYIVHLEACKLNLQGLPRRRPSNLLRTLSSFVFTILTLIILSGVVYYGLGWIKTLAGDATPWVASLLLLLAYVGLVKLSCTVPELDTSHQINELPDLRQTATAGYYFLLPVVVLVWSLTVERLSPGLSAFWATVFMIFVLLTQRRLKGFFRNKQDREHSFAEGWSDLLRGLADGARNMIGIGVATAAAGIVVGTVTLTGIGLVMTEFVEFISGGNLPLILLFTAIISLLLGMGLPTTANYIVVSTLMAPVIVTLGAEQGLIVPLIAVHLFVFYFGILADDTPPVGLAAFAAAAISQGDPIRTGIQGFAYDIRTAILPFMFIFNTELLMIGIDSWLEAVVVIAGSVVGMLAFAAATQGFFFTRNRVWETLALLLATFTLLRPGFWWDEIYPPFVEKPGIAAAEVAAAAVPGSQLRLTVAGERLSGEPFTKTVMLPVLEADGGEARLQAAGIETREEDGRLIIDHVVFASPAEKSGLDFDQQLLNVQVPSDRPAKQWMFIPAIALISLVVLLQRRRRVGMA
jgi:TRAP transporter 4TM/12TM fusion protein